MIKVKRNTFNTNSDLFSYSHDIRFDNRFLNWFFLRTFLLEKFEMTLCFWYQQSLFKIEHLIKYVYHISYTYIVS